MQVVDRRRRSADIVERDGRKVFLRPDAVDDDHRHGGVVAASPVPRRDHEDTPNSVGVKRLQLLDLVVAILSGLEDEHVTFFILAEQNDPLHQIAEEGVVQSGDAKADTARLIAPQIGRHGIAPVVQPRSGVNHPRAQRRGNRRLAAQRIRGRPQRHPRLARNILYRHRPSPHRIASDGLPSGVK